MEFKKHASSWKHCQPKGFEQCYNQQISSDKGSNKQVILWTDVAIEE